MDMYIKTNKDMSHVLIENEDIETLTNEEIGELIKIGYEKSRTEECFKKNVKIKFVRSVEEYNRRMDSRYKIKIESLFKNFEQIKEGYHSLRDIKFYVYVQRKK